MSEKIALVAEKREVSGKKVSGLRRNGSVPAVIYEKGKESVNLSVEYMPLHKAYVAAGFAHPVEIEIGSKKYFTMIKDVHMDPVKHTIMHVAFHAVNANDPVEAQIPLKMVGQAPASVAGLFVHFNMDSITVKGLPNNMPDSIEVDVTGVVTEDDDIRANALVIPSNLEVIDLDPERVIISVTVPRAEVEKESEEEVAAADVPSDNGGEKADSTEE
jgi:large subunit ribosomal protein L25